jgi:hypothetical protein
MRSAPLSTCFGVFNVLFYCLNREGSTCVFMAGLKVHLLRAVSSRHLRISSSFDRFLASLARFAEYTSSLAPLEAYFLKFTGNVPWAPWGV